MFENISASENLPKDVRIHISLENKPYIWFGKIFHIYTHTHLYLFLGDF